METRSLDRKSFFAFSAAGLAPLLTSTTGGWGSVDTPRVKPETPAEPHPAFPAQDPEQVLEMVLVAHSDVDRVRALVVESPELAKAAVDWGFGDWESALGAASHMGRRDIAEVLLENGARPSLFSAAMLGQLTVFVPTSKHPRACSRF